MFLLQNLYHRDTFTVGANHRQGAVSVPGHINSTPCSAQRCRPPSAPFTVLSAPILVPSWPPSLSPSEGLSSASSQHAPLKRYSQVPLLRTYLMTLKSRAVPETPLTSFCFSWSFNKCCGSYLLMSLESVSSSQSLGPAAVAQAPHLLLAAHQPLPSSLPKSLPCL